MQLDALFINGVLNPIELFSLHKSIDAYLQTISPKALAHAIQIFAEDVAQKDREYTQERHDADEKDAEVVWGAQLNYLDLLAEAVDRVTGQQAILPVHKYMVRTFHLYLTPSTMILEGPFPSESSAFASSFPSAGSAEVMHRPHSSTSSRSH